MPISLAQIFVYPIKSLGGIALREAQVERRGLRFDRRWMLVDADGQFLSQRRLPLMARLRTAIRPPFLEVFQIDRPDFLLRTPLEPDAASMPRRKAQVWSWAGSARLCGAEADDFFSDFLKTEARLVFMPDGSRRRADGRYAPKGQFVSFADGFPFLAISQASLDFLNARLPKGEGPLSMDRFRPNFVFDGAAPFEEDSMRDFQIAGQPFRAVKPCARCVMTTIDQQTAVQGKEPLRTLAEFRRANGRILFGQNVIWLGDENRPIVRAGDSVGPLSA